MTRVIRLCALIAAIASPFLADSSRAGGPIRVNPQPLPPIHSESRPQGSNARINVNPQPLPRFTRKPHGGSNAPVNVNPQPQPPRLASPQIPPAAVAAVADAVSRRRPAKGPS